MVRLRQITVTVFVLLIIIAVMVSCAPAAPTAPAAPAAAAPAASVGNVKALNAALEKSECTLKLAPFVHVDLIQLYQVGRLGNAGGNNADAPYRAVFGAIPDDIAIKDVDQIAGAQAKVDNWLYTTQGLIQGWQINPNDALVIVTKTPPECVYFSYCGFIFYKYYEKEKQQKWVWTSFNDPLNISTIKTSGTPNGEKGDPFDKDTIIIMTADKGTDRLVRNAALAAGYTEDIINTYVIPSSMVKLGIGPEYDTMVFGQRMALFTDDKAGQEYVNTVTAAIRVIPGTQGKIDPFPMPDLRVRGTGITEWDLQPALEDLRTTILAKYSNLAAEELGTRVWLTESYDAVQTEVYVAGESRDTSYLRSDTLTLGNNPDELVIAYGINHTAIGKATYANCNYYGEKGWNGVAGIYSTEYAGSAESYLPDNPMAKYLYVCKFVRNCDSEKNCVTVPTGPGAFGVGLDEPAFIGFRAYLEPSTKVGPINTELVYDRVIKFNTR